MSEIDDWTGQMTDNGNTTSLARRYASANPNIQSFIGGAAMAFGLILIGYSILPLLNIFLTVPAYFDDGSHIVLFDVLGVIIGFDIFVLGVFSTRLGASRTGYTAQTPIYKVPEIQKRREVQRQLSMRTSWKKHASRLMPDWQRYSLNDYNALAMTLTNGRLQVKSLDDQTTLTVFTNIVMLWSHALNGTTFSSDQHGFTMLYITGNRMEVNKLVDAYFSGEDIHSLLTSRKAA